MNASVHARDGLPAVAVVIPCHQQARFLSECLDSVLAQTSPDWIAIVVNDGSTDATDDVVASYRARDPRIRGIGQANRGLGAARNAGIAASDSRYILPLDADDRIAPTFLATCAAVLDVDAAVAVVHTRCRYFGAIDAEMQMREYSFDELLRGNIFPATALYRRSDFQRTGGYDTRMPGWEDWDFWLRLLRPDSRVHRVDEPLFFYRRSAESMITRINRPDVHAELRRHVFRNHVDLYNEHFPDPLNLFHRVKQLEKQLAAANQGPFSKVARWLKTSVARRAAQ